MIQIVIQNLAIMWSQAIDQQYSCNERKLERWIEKDRLRTDVFLNQCAESNEIDNVDVIGKKIKREKGKYKETTIDQEFDNFKEFDK